MPYSATLNVMIKAARRAGRSLKRDLGEVENLHVSLKGPRNFVTAADRRAEEIVREELAKARPDYGFLGEEGGAHAVKLEGGERVAEQIALLTAAGIPVMAHIGFTPQSVNSLGGFRVQGRGDAAEQTVADAIAVAEAGAFSVVMEMVPAELATQITGKLTIPTIGIGAGPEECPALRRELRLLGDHAGGDAVDVGNFGTAETEGVRLAGLLLFGRIGVADRGQRDEP